MKAPTRTLRILIIRLSSLGDIVLTSLLARRLRARFPGAHISMLTESRFTEILDGFPTIDKIFSYSSSIPARKKTRRLLKRIGFDIVIDLQNKIKSRDITSGISPVSEFRFHRDRWNRWKRIHQPGRRRNLKPQTPVALAYLDAVRPLGVHDDGSGLNLDVRKEWMDNADEIIARYAMSIDQTPDSRLLVIAPGSRHQTKTWQPDKWVEFLHHARREYPAMQVVIGSRDEAGLCSYIAENAGHDVLNLAGRLRLGDLAAVIKRAAMLLTADSAPMHIAAATRTPVIAVFGPTVPEFGFAPFRCRSWIVQVNEDLVCRPCHAHGPRKCPEGHFKCMADISAEQLIGTFTEAVKSLESGTISRTQ